MKRDWIILAAFVAASITVVGVVTKKIIDDDEFYEARRENPIAWKLDAERVITKTNDVSISGVERSEYRKMQYAFYDIVSNYNK